MNATGAIAPIPFTRIGRFAVSLWRSTMTATGPVTSEISVATESLPPGIPIREIERGNEGNGQVEHKAARGTPYMG